MNGFDMTVTNSKSTRTTCLVSLLPLISMTFICLFLASCKTIPIERLVDDEGRPNKTICIYENQIVSSPNARWELSRRENPNGNESQVWLKDRNTLHEREIYTFGRQVSAIWSPDSTKILLTDHEASNASFCVLLFVKEGIQPVPIGSLLSDELADSPYAAFSAGDKWYLEGVRWRGSRTVDLVLHGWSYLDNPTCTRLFCLYVTYRMGRGFSDIRLVKDETIYPDVSK
jgi:hypothetical protein